MTHKLKLNSQIREMSLRSECQAVLLILECNHPPQSLIGFILGLASWVIGVAYRELASRQVALLFVDSSIRSFSAQY